MPPHGANASKRRAIPAGVPKRDGLALLGEESAAGEVTHQRLIDRRAVELEVADVRGERQRM
jgi:hypothetical protein